MTKPVGELIEKLGYDPERGRELWRRALTHRSAEGLPHYERLEFLGDAVLKMVTSRWLYERHTELDEGDMTKVRARAVKDETLAEIARQLDLGEYLILGASEKRSRGRTKEGTLASAFEAVLGAVYLIYGAEEADRFLEVHLGAEMAVSLRVGGLDNYKAVLQEYTQGLHKLLPEYRLEAELGPEHDRVYEVGVWVNGERRGMGRGRSKKTAEQMAAQAALADIRGPSDAETSRAGTETLGPGSPPAPALAPHEDPR